jgi:hypothetical protein
MLARIDDLEVVHEIANLLPNGKSAKVLCGRLLLFGVVFDDRDEVTCKGCLRKIAQREMAS